MEPRKHRHQETTVGLTTPSRKQLLPIGGIVLGIVLVVVLILFIVGPLFAAALELVAECVKSFRTAVGGS
jgi:hypothetical protein